MIEVACRVKIYEVDGREPDEGIINGPKLAVLSHWNRNDLVCLRFRLEDVTGGVKGEKTITVLRKDLEAAIQNASNAAR